MDLFIIPDGNRRWAKERERDYNFGYQQLPITISRVIDILSKKGIRKLYFWCNSINNLKRPLEQVKSYLGFYLDILNFVSLEGGVRVHIRGNINLFPEEFAEKFYNLQDKTKNNQGFDLYYFFNYTTQDDIERAMNKSVEVKRGDIKKILADMDEPNNLDVVLRTGAEPGYQRLSGFYPIKSPNAEIIFVPEYFPDITEEHIVKIINIYKQRKVNDGL